MKRFLYLSISDFSITAVSALSCADDHAASQTLRTVVKYRILPLCDRALRFVGFDFQRTLPRPLYRYALFPLTVAELRRARKRLFIGREGNKIKAFDGARIRIKRTFVAVGNIENIFPRVLFYDEPSAVLALPAAEIEPAPLPQSVIHNALVKPDLFPVERKNFSALCR